MFFSRNKVLEWSGVITAITYSLLVAMNIGAEFLGFLLLLISAILIGVYSFTTLGLVQTHSILSFFPLIVVAFSGPILKEKIGIQRWLAVLFGFLGVLIILDPANFVISFDAILPIIGAFVLGFYTIFKKQYPQFS